MTLRAADALRRTNSPPEHTQRHTAASWLMQRGVPLWEAAGFLGMSVGALQDNDGHHPPRLYAWRG
jgi:hypothetical protein